MSQNFNWLNQSAGRSEPRLEHIRDPVDPAGHPGTCTAAIWQNVFGLELRVEHDGELMESRLSRFGQEPLVLIAEQLKAGLMEQGWFDDGKS